MSSPSGFDYQRRKDGSLVITHHGKPSVILRGAKADRFLEKLGTDDQGLMARVTGNYKRGNERR